MEVLFLMGGDFNLIRYAHEKSNDNLHWSWMNMFISFIDDTGIREMHSGGSRYTWTNKQQDPVMSNLDRVFVTPKWEDKYPRGTARSLTRIGSDHAPILVDTGKHAAKKEYIFIFEMAWLTQEGFKEKMIQKWPERKEQNILDYWKKFIIDLRKFCRGWGRNFDCEVKKDKKLLLNEIMKIDEMAENTGKSKINGIKYMI